MSKLTDADVDWLSRQVSDRNVISLIEEVRESRRLLRKMVVVAWGVRWTEGLKSQSARFSLQEDRDHYWAHILDDWDGEERRSARRFRVLKRGA